MHPLIKIFLSHIFDMVKKNVEFGAAFDSVDKGAKMFTQKRKRVENFCQLYSNKK